MNRLYPRFMMESRKGSSVGLLAVGIAIVLLLMLFAVVFIRGCRSDRANVEKDEDQSSTLRRLPGSASKVPPPNETASVVKAGPSPPTKDGGAIETKDASPARDSNQKSGSSAAGKAEAPNSKSSNTGSETAIVKAREHLLRAHGAAKAEDPGQAFIHARNAWLALKSQKDNARSRMVAEEALAAMRNYAQQTNARFETNQEGTLFGKPLIEK